VNESTIIPDQLQNELFRIRDNETHDSWRLGDITIEIFEYNRLNATGAKDMEIYKAVGSMAGKASRTVREYYATSQLFGDHEREQFDMLSFSHFRIAARLQSPMEALEWAAAQVEVTGKPATVDAMEAMYGKHSSPGRDDIEYMMGFPDAIRDVIDRYREHIPENIIEKVWKQTEDLETTIKEIAPFIDGVYNKTKGETES